MPELDNNTLNIQVAAIINATTDRQKERALAAVFNMLVDAGTLQMWARRFASKGGYRDQHGIADIEQVIAEKILVTLRKVTPENASRVRDWAGFFHGIAQNAVIDYLASSQVSVAGRMSGVTKRQNIIARTARELLAEFGREPTRAEIIDRANKWAVEHHKDARKQGLLLSEKDFVQTGMAPVSLDESPTVAPAMESEGEMHSEAQLALRRLQTVARELFPDDAVLEQVVNAWISCVAGGERPAHATIARIAGLDGGPVRHAMVQLNDVLDEVRARYGE